MNRVVSGIVLFLACGMVHAASVTGAQFGAQLKATELLIDEGLKKADTVLNRKQYHFFVNAGLLVGVMQEEFKGIREKADYPLTNSELQTYRALETVTMQVDQLQRGISRDPVRAMDAVRAAVRMLPERFELPRPSLITMLPFSQNHQAPQTVVIRGVNLQHGDNYILMGGAKHPCRTVSDGHAMQCRVALAQKVRDVTGTKTAEIHLFKKPKWNFFGLLGSKEFVYRAEYAVLPSKIADVTLSYDIKRYRVEYTDTYTGTVTVTPDSCEERVNEEVFLVRNYGWKIDKHSVKVKKMQGAYEAACNVPASDTHTTSIYAEAKGRCYCVDDIKTRCGTTECRVSWKERKEFPIRRKEEMTEPLYYGLDTKIMMPDFLNRFNKMVVTYFDGTTFSTPGKSGRNNGIVFRYDPEHQTVSATFVSE